MKKSRAQARLFFVATEMKRKNLRFVYVLVLK